MTSSLISAIILGVASATSVQWQYNPYSGYSNPYASYYGGGRQHYHYAPAPNPYQAAAQPSIATQIELLQKAYVKIAGQVNGIQMELVDFQDRVDALPDNADNGSNNEGGDESSTGTVIEPTSVYFWTNSSPIITNPGETNNLNDAFCVDVGTTLLFQAQTAILIIKIPSFVEHEVILNLRKNDCGNGIGNGEGNDTGNDNNSNDYGVCDENSNGGNNVNGNNGNCECSGIVARGGFSSVGERQSISLIYKEAVTKDTSFRIDVSNNSSNASTGPILSGLESQVGYQIYDSSEWPLTGILGDACAF